MVMTMNGPGVRGSFGSSVAIAATGAMVFLVARIGTGTGAAALVAVGAVALAALMRAAVKIRAGFYAVRVRNSLRPRTWDSSVREIVGQMPGTFVLGARDELFASPGIVVNASAATIAYLVEPKGSDLLARVLLSHWTTAIARHGAVVSVGVRPWVTWRVDDELSDFVFRLCADQLPRSPMASA